MILVRTLLPHHTEPLPPRSEEEWLQQQRGRKTLNTAASHLPTVFHHWQLRPWVFLARSPYSLGAGNRTAHYKGIWRTSLDRSSTAAYLCSGSAGELCLGVWECPYMTFTFYCYVCVFCFLCFVFIIIIFVLFLFFLLFWFAYSSLPL